MASMKTYLGRTNLSVVPQGQGLFNQPCGRFASRAAACQFLTSFLSFAGGTGYTPVAGPTFAKPSLLTAP
jgi:hypothetical protein